MANAIMIVSAHPDDEVLLCGGTIARLVEEQPECAVVIVTVCTSGLERTRGDRDSDTLLAQRMNAILALGVQARAMYVHDLGFEDQRLSLPSIASIADSLSVQIARHRPHTIYTHYDCDLNADHRIVAKAVFVATRVLGRLPIRIMSGEVASSTEWATDGAVFEPNVFVTLQSRHVEAKVAAMECYVSERRAFPHPRSSGGLRALAAIRGVRVGHPYAESFRLMKECM